ncbi:MAG: hypothetical protein RR681_02265, partial [Lachnospiraceae bacterium]
FHFNFLHFSISISQIQFSALHNSILDWLWIDNMLSIFSAPTTFGVFLTFPRLKRQLIKLVNK